MQAIVLLALVICAGLAPRWGRPGAIVLAVLSIAWIPLNHSMEGPILLTLTDAHGITTADMASLGGFVVAAYVWLRDDRPMR